MQWSNLSIGKQIRIGFGIILSLLVAIGAIGYVGISRMKTKAALVIDGNKLDAKLAQSEVDHLNRANAINAFLTDPKVVDLDIEENEHDCMLGQWLESPERRKYESDISSIKPLIKAIEAPHAELHQSAVEIKKVFRQVDPDLLGFLNESESDHLRWASQIREAFMQKSDTLGIETDPEKCSLGRWFDSPEAKTAYQNGNSEFKKSWEALVIAHKKLHESTIEIEKNIAFKQADTAMKERKALISRIEETAKELNAMLDELVAEVVRPHRQDAETNNNVSELILWSTAEEAINQNIIRGLLEMQRILSQYETEKSQDLWDKFNSLLPDYNSGMGSALTTLNSKPGLHEKTNKISELSRQYLADAASYKQKMEIGMKAEAATQKAQKIFDESTMPLLDDTIHQLGIMKAQVEEDLKGVANAQNIYAARTLPALKNLQAGLKEIRTQAKKSIITDEEMLESVKLTQKTVTVIGALALLVGILFAYFVPKGIIKMMYIISRQMDDAAGQVASAAQQMSASSQSLADGTAEQAAAMGDTSSSLDTMAAKTQQNEANVKEADKLMKGANVLVNEADGAMDELSDSIREISVASEETQNIIKTIDEIAFQTNLLALNAAVEAARAGEAGAGFSVVADEVRNLAIRAAEAAKNTSELIEGTVRRVQTGAGIVDRTNDAMTKVSQSALKVGELLSEIAVASHDNTSGIAKINQNISDVDSVTQQNASSAEQTASASEEMAAQAEQMKDLVKALRRMVGFGSGERQKQLSGQGSQIPMLAIEAPEREAIYEA